MNITEEFIKGLRAGYLLIHPTDTIPGLTYDPLNESGFELLCSVKKRELTKTCIGLVSSLDMASRFFKDLSSEDLELLKKYWPAPLSVVAQASSEAPRSLVRNDGSISLRFPDLAPNHTWLYEVISELNAPLPTTSINESGEPAVSEWKDADLFAESCDKVINLVEQYEIQSKDPSTIVRIKSGKFEILRQGKQLIRDEDLGAEK